MPILEREQLIERPLPEVFEFFSLPHNLEKLTPTFLKFKIKSEGKLEMKAGLLIDYRISLYGIPMSWRTEITAYEPMSMFIDRQVKGPYKKWVHTHRFEAVSETQTRISDHVDYEVGFGPLGAIAHALFVKRNLNAIFNYRHVAAERIFQAA